METKQIIGYGLLGAVIGGFIGAVAMPEKVLTVEKTNPVDAVLKEQLKVTQEELRVLREAEPEVITETVEVEVPSENMGLVLDHIYDNSGDVDYLLDDLDDDEVDKIVDRIVFINDVKKLAVDAVKAELFDEIDGDEITLADNTTYEFDEDDLERLKIDDEDDELIIADVDFEDSDAEVEVSFRFEDDDEVEFEGTCIAKFRDGEFDELTDIEIEERV